jgi:hypothetical protein
MPRPSTRVRVSCRSHKPDGRPATCFVLVLFYSILFYSIIPASCGTRNAHDNASRSPSHKTLLDIPDAECSDPPLTSMTKYFRANSRRLCRLGCGRGSGKSTHNQLCLEDRAAADRRSDRVRRPQGEVLSLSSLVTPSRLSCGASLNRNGGGRARLSWPVGGRLRPAPPCQVKFARLQWIARHWLLTRRSWGHHPPPCTLWAIRQALLAPALRRGIFTGPPREAASILRTCSSGSGRPQSADRRLGARRSSRPGTLGRVAAGVVALPVLPPRAFASETSSSSRPAAGGC